MRRHYIVVREERLTRLLDQVNELLVDGFDLVGGISQSQVDPDTNQHTLYYLQAMVREEKE